MAKDRCTAWRVLGLAGLSVRPLFLGLVSGCGLALGGCSPQLAGGSAPMMLPGADLEPMIPTAAPALLNKAAVARRAGHADEALYYYVQALEREPGSLPALLGIGGIHREKGNGNLAEVAYRLALQTAPRNIEALEGLGLAQFQQQANADAQQSLEAVIAADSQRWQASNVLGLIADHQNHPNAAIVCSPNAIAPCY